MSIDFPPLTVGLWRLASWRRDARASAAWARACVDLGLDLFDLADIYGDHSCEELFGAALATDPELRARARIVTKSGIRFPSARRPEVHRHHYDSSAAHVVASAERSLAALGVERIELLLLHRPDLLADPDELSEAFERLARDGKVLHFGVSNHTPSQLALLAARVPVPLVTNQVEASVLHLAPFTDGTFDQCQERGLRPMAWSPLAGGRLFDADDERATSVRAALSDLGTARGGAQLDALAFAFLARHPSRPVPITGTGDLGRVRAALEGLELELSREEWYALWTASTGSALP